MPKFHVIIAWLVLLLLILHLIMGSVTLLSPVFLLQSQFAVVFLGFVCVHGARALWKTLGRKKPRALLSYAGRNRGLWVRVLSGAAILILAFIHRTLWTIRTPFGVLLRDFEWPSLLAQELLTAALLIHILLNLRPLLMDSGLESGGRLLRGMIGVTLALGALAVAGAAAYYFSGGAA